MHARAVRRTPKKTIRQEFPRKPDHGARPGGWPDACLPRAAMRDSPSGGVLVFGVVVGSLLGGCSSHSASKAGTAPGDAGTLGASADASGDAGVGQAELSAGRWSDALAVCTAAEMTQPDDCDARWCDLLARAMLVNDQFNTFVLPRYRAVIPSANTPLAPGDQMKLMTLYAMLQDATKAADAVLTRNCERYLPSVPFTMGDGPEPIVSGEFRGWFTVRDAHI